LTNTGPVIGSEAVQLYVTLPDTSELSHPPLQLKAFKKVKSLKPGAKEQVVLKLDKYAVSYWDERIDRWVVERGEYGVRVGGSSSAAGLLLKGKFVIWKSFEWRGL
jgi:beta-glucosidase